MIYKLLISHVGKDGALALKIVKAIEEKSKTPVDNIVIKPIYMEDAKNGCVGDFMVWSEMQVKNSDGILALITDNTIEERTAPNGTKLNDKVVYNEIRYAQDNALDIVIMKNNSTVIPDGRGYNISLQNQTKVYFNVNGKDIEQKIEEAIAQVLTNARNRLIYKKPNLHYVPGHSTAVDTKPTSIEDTSIYLGRQEEIAQIDKYFAENKNIVCLTGFGGMGKTTLAKMYAKSHPETNVSIQYCSIEENDLRNPITNIPLEYDSEEYIKLPIEEKFSIRLRQFEKIGKKTLIIIDNFDADFSTYTNRESITNLANLKNKNCMFLISSRLKPERQEVGLVNVGRLNDDDLFNLFYRDSKCRKTEENEKAIRKLIDITSGHTMTIELSARAIALDENDITPKEFVENFASAIKESESNIDNRYRAFGNMAPIYEHLKVLFTMAKITENQKLLLGNLSFVCKRGLELNELNPIRLFLIRIFRKAI